MVSYVCFTKIDKYIAYALIWDTCHTDVTNTSIKVSNFLFFKEAPCPVDPNAGLEPTTLRPRPEQR